MSAQVTDAAVLIVPPLVALAVPVVGVAMLFPSLEASERARVTNYRGRQVVLGLGIVWLFWCLAILAIAVVQESVRGSVDLGVLDTLRPPLVAVGILALVVFTVGLVDDAMGSPADRGLGGHFRALFRGRLTTGLLKLLVISLFALLAAWVTMLLRYADAAPLPTSRFVALVVLGGAAVALTSNFVNLTDLRPGRALKTYSLLVVVSAPMAFASLRYHGFPTAESLAICATGLLVFLAPALAVWRFDLGERGMLGDAGANPAGAVAGLLVVAWAPLWGIALYAAVMLALNLASERWSFSAVIEKNRVLSWLDGIGRLPADAPATDYSANTSPQSGEHGG